MSVCSNNSLPEVNVVFLADSDSTAILVSGAPTTYSYDAHVLKN